MGRGLWVRTLALTRCQPWVHPLAPMWLRDSPAWEGPAPHMGRALVEVGLVLRKERAGHVLGNSLEQVSSKRGVPLNS